MNTTQNIQNKATVIRLYEEVFNHSDLNAIDTVIAPDITIHDPMMGEMHGVDAFRQLAAFFRTAFPQQHTTVGELVSEGDLVAALHTHTGVNTGSFMGMPPTGRSIKIIGLELFRIANGKIVEMWRHDDDAGLMRQLGLIPAPAAENSPV